VASVVALSVEETTWEFPNSICSCFPKFILEHKANFIEGDIDRNHALKWDKPFQTYQRKSKPKSS